MKRVFTCVLFVLAVTGDAPVSCAATLELEDFQSGGTGGWSTGPSGTGLDLVQLLSDGGPNGAGDVYVEVTGLGGFSAGSVPAVLNNGAAWTGNLTSLGINGLSLDLMNEPTSSRDLSLRLVLFNGSTQWTSTQAVTVPR
ncbi:MAG: hypothetical protein KDA60_20815, partial [Planctomycetales bacterium]|nr:hypothetical protein [Planctomycetales bacterium]